MASWRYCFVFLVGMNKYENGKSNALSIWRRSLECTTDLISSKGDDAYCRLVNNSSTFWKYIDEKYSTSKNEYLLRIIDFKTLIKCLFKAITMLSSDCNITMIDKWRHFWCKSTMYNPNFQFTDDFIYSIDFSSKIIHV